LKLFAKIPTVIIFGRKREKISSNGDPMQGLDTNGTIVIIVENFSWRRKVPRYSTKSSRKMRLSIFANILWKKMGYGVLKE